LTDRKNIKQIIEVLLFAADEPLTINQLVKVLEDSVDPNDITPIIDELNSDYENSDRTFRVGQIGGGFQLLTQPEFSHYIKNLYKGRAKPRLSQAGLEVLSIIAFKQPITRPEIDQIRGVNSDGVVKSLFERNLVSITGRSETAGRALLYRTTDNFLRYFGINKIEDLPKPREIEELLGSAQEELPFASEEEDKKITEVIEEMDETPAPDDQAQ
jgi:segregation and condensation protein B